MRRLLVTVIAVAGLVAIAVVAQADPDPVTCDGYPEPRVFMENQTWVEPMPTDPANPHPGDGQQGHIHISTCFPLYQKVTTDTIGFDIRVQLHNVPGDPIWFLMRAYTLGNAPSVFLKGEDMPLPDGCDGVDCDEWFHVEYPLSTINSSGWADFHLAYAVKMDNGVNWYNLNRWTLYVENGQPVDSTPMSQTRITRLGGDTWVHNPAGSEYSEAWINRPDYPWDETTGELTPLSGMWELDVSFCCGHLPATTGLVTVDPALHADPPDLGTVVYDGAAGQNIPVAIDTTTLANGEHKLLLAACNPEVSGGLTNCGVLVVRFLVGNVDQMMEPGESLTIGCPTTLSGVIEEDQAVLVCAP